MFFDHVALISVKRSPLKVELLKKRKISTESPSSVNVLALDASQNQ